MSTSATAPAVVVCPEWCAFTQDEHLEELRSPVAGGDVHHKSAPDAWATLAHVRQADGSVLPDDGEPVILVYARQDVTRPKPSSSSATCRPHWPCCAPEPAYTRPDAR